MEQTGGCCIARCDGGVYHPSKVDKMMQRFRPIAPKPANSATGSFPATTGDVMPVNSEYSVKTTFRGRRKSSVKVSKPYLTDRKKKYPVKTLSFFPEAPEESLKIGVKESFPTCVSFADCSQVIPMAGHVGIEMAPPPVLVVGSWVKVECVINDWYGAVGCTDEERLIGLGLDTCPGLITDGLNNVIWVNGAYKKMVGGEGQVAAMVVVGEGVALPLGCVAFTCRVRVVTCGKESGCKTMPCDAWRMDCGGFAWRLDTMTALCLGW